jgi:hypothetical protein
MHSFITMRAPIFIIGFPRSGTSFVGKLISRFTGYQSHGESHTLTLLQEVHHRINLYRRRTDFTGKELVKQLDMQALKDLNTSFFRDFYLGAYGSEQFIDKTPGAVACHGWGVVKEVFPNAVFVACVRSPVEVFESAVLKFGGLGGEGSKTNSLEVAEGWVAAMAGIEKMAASPFAADLHVLSQLELRADPSTAVTKLFRFLGLPESTIPEGIALCNSSREDVLTEAINKPAYKTLSQLAITPTEAEQFRSICAAMCSRWEISL